MKSHSGEQVNLLGSNSLFVVIHEIHDLEYRHAWEDKNLLDGMMSHLAAWPLSTCSKWRLPMLNFGLLWRLISWDSMHFRN